MQTPPSPPPQGRFFRPFSLVSDVTVIPNRLMRYTGLSIGAKATYAALARMSCGATFCYPGQDRLLFELGMTRRQTLAEYILELEQHRFLFRERKGHNKKQNRYHFLMHPLFSELVNQHPDTDPPPPPDEPPAAPRSPEDRQTAGENGPYDRTLSCADSEHDNVRPSTVDMSEKRTSQCAESAHPLIGRAVELELYEKSSSSSRTTSAHGRAPEEEECSYAPIRQLLAPWGGGPRPASRLLAAARRVDPDISPPAVAALIPASIPPSFTVRSAGYFETAIPDLMRSAMYATLRPYWQPGADWSQTGPDLQRMAANPANTHAWRQAAWGLLEMRPYLDPHYAEWQAEQIRESRQTAQDQRSKNLKFWRELANDPAEPAESRQYARRMIAEAAEEGEA